MAVCLVSCDKDDLMTASGPPSNVSATFEISQDNSGTVTITPTADNASVFLIRFGDGTSGSALLGSSATHVYAEGTYTVEIEALNGTDQTVIYTENITISFSPPANLMIGVTTDATNPAVRSVTPSAANATMFDVFFGEAPNDPVSIMAGETASYTYGASGDYTIRVVAKGASSTTIEATEMVTIAMGTAAIELPVDLESSASVAYSFFAFGYDGAGAGVVDNPNPTGINTSAKVGAFNKAAGAEVWSGMGFDLGTVLDFANNDQFRLKVHSPKAGAVVKLKVENADDASIAFERDKTTSTMNAWEELTYDFSGIDASQSYAKVIIFFDFGVTGDGSDYYFDDLVLEKFVPPTCDDDAPGNDDVTAGPLNFTNATGDQAFGQFGNIVGEVVSNPAPNDVNRSCNVYKYEKSTGCEVWSGVGYEIPTALDFNVSTGDQFTIDVMGADRLTDVTIILERLPFPDQDPAVSVTMPMTGTVGEWETLTFDFSGHTDKTFKNVLVYFDQGAVCGGSVFYFDNLKQAVSGECVADDTMNDDTSVGPLNLTFSDEAKAFGIFGGIAGGIVDNPVADITNNSCKVYEYHRTVPSGVTCEPWAGSGYEVPIPLDFNSSSDQFTLDVMGLDKTTTVTVLLERLPFPDVDPSVAVTADMTVGVGEWETLSFDFSGHLDKTFKNILVYFDRGAACDDARYYFDNLKQVN